MWLKAEGWKILHGKSQREAEATYLLYLSSEVGGDNVFCAVVYETGSISMDVDGGNIFSNYYKF